MNLERFDDAITLAGLLAEAGVQRIEYRTPGGEGGQRACAARVTDLPGLLAGAPVGTELHWPGGGARVDETRIRWWGVGK